MASSFVPVRGDIVRMSFSPQTGHEPAGWRPALVQVRSLDWRARSARLVEHAPADVMEEVLARLAPLVT